MTLVQMNLMIEPIDKTHWDDLYARLHDAYVECMKYNNPNVATKPMLYTELLNQLQELTQSTNLTPSVESAIHNLMVSARKEGYDDGYEQGYDEGWDDGSKKAYDDGWTEGVESVRSGILGD